MNVYSAAITLIFVMDPLGNIPIFLSTLSHVEPKRRYWVIFRESIFAFLILCAFLFFGNNILSGLGVSQPALSISGGIILFLIALKMIFPPVEVNRTEKQMLEPFIVPLAIPFIAGPSAIATVMLFASQYPSSLFTSFLSLVIASGASTGILLIAPQLRRLLGQRGLIAVERLMGMILTTISVQMFLRGLEEYFH
jgi:multiple antibiotic resistance protein